MFYLIYIILSALLGIYFIIHFQTTKPTSILEGYINSDSKKGFTCPDILLQKGIRYYLYNSKLATVPGVNPIEFQNLEDYTEFMEWQRSQGIRCPVLYLQYSYNTQGEPIYKGRPGPSDLQGGLPPAPSNYPAPIPAPSQSIITEDDTTTATANMGSASAEPQNEASNNLLHNSASAMDDNWGGIQYTQELIDSGVYNGNNVSIAIN